MVNEGYHAGDSWMEENFVVSLDEFGVDIDGDKDVEVSFAVKQQITVCHRDVLCLTIFDEVSVAQECIDVGEVDTGFLVLANRT